MKKSLDYGPSWSILRMPSVTDQIYIKAERIRSIQETEVNKVGESIEGEFIAIVNYCIIALILLEKKRDPQYNIPEDVEKLGLLYDQKATYAFEVMSHKNHDYGEAWRNMRISSITDLILMKIFRLKQIEDRQGKLLVSEGPEANYVDMLIYAVFSLIKMGEEEGKL
ncbi:MAG: DUF1599 domain-containing protein [Bacteroidia bacterium]|nr:DUF1599 domain-containing protein [Bacteroidia bacterium]